MDKDKLLRVHVVHKTFVAEVDEDDWLAADEDTRQEMLWEIAMDNGFLGDFTYENYSPAQEKS